MNQVINSVEVANFDEEGTTISVNATAGDRTETFHVQTVDGEYRGSMGCWMFTDSDGEDLDREEYPDFDFSEIISEAEKLAESNLEDCEENPNYINKDSSPYSRRFIKREA